MSWRTAAYRAVRPLLFAADPERIHHLALGLLGAAPGRWLAPLASGVGDPSRHPVELMGLRFRNRVGLGAGFDKDGVAIRGWAALGFGFIELGTVTPRPQAGNPRPRLFRLPKDAALVNRMGFNNAGADALAARIADARVDLPPGFVIGVNIGRNRDGDAEDYPAAARAVAGVADYLAINVSSPNTPGLRDLEDPARLRELLALVRDAAPDRPIVVKLSPDLTHNRRADIIRALPGAADGVILSNTTTTRVGRRSASAVEPGGLSGAPLRSGMLAATAEARRIAGRELAIIASGGIGSGSDGSAALEAGADLVQLWTGMIYAGPGLIGEAVAAC
ncbi:MAG TPA: quinone-dependent dihydroorotate dehydrogenase [Patescibacteria group bacterium]|nr:quinone-dependent dihydroorotate dehydrogenase [Patescibacteria group bacterium]